MTEAEAASEATEPMPAEQAAQPAPAEQAPAEQAAPARTGPRTCTTCGRAIEAEEGWVSFSCPGCGKAAIVRCASCKVLENQYVCKQCKFEGP